MFWGDDIVFPEERCPNGCDSTIMTKQKKEHEWFSFCTQCKRLGPKADSAQAAADAWDRMAKDQF